MDYNARISEIVDISPEIKIFRVRPVEGRLDYKAGQFAVLGLPDAPARPDGEWHRRAYSIASAPSADYVEFYIVLVENGRLTTRLFKLNEGDRIFMGEKPAGIMTFDGAGTKDVLFISTGTGIAPFVSILREHRAELLDAKRGVGLIHGARHSFELGFKPELEELASSTPYFRYYPVVSRADDYEEWKGARGHAQDLLATGMIERDFGRPLTPDNFEIFLCGNPRMVDELVERFTAMGFVRNTPARRGNLYFDKH